MSVDVKYRMSATATGGRDRHIRTENRNLDARLTTPKELGGPGGEGTNPEQAVYRWLFCVLSVLDQGRWVAAETRSAIGRHRHRYRRNRRALGRWLGITAELLITVPGVERGEAQQLIATAHQSRPYSNATRNNVDVRPSLKDELL